jgi:hypothetical protein
MDDSPPVRITGVQATVHDISRSGICLDIQETLHPGERRTLRLDDELDGSTQEFEAEVVWAHSARAGLRWLQLSREQDRWLFQRFLPWMGGGSRRGS